MRFCTNRITSEIQNLGTIAGQPANSISVAEDEKGNMQFFALGMANYMGGGDALLVFQQNNGELIPMHGSGDIRSLAEHKPMAARSPQGKDIYHLFTVGQGQVPYMHTADMSADGHSGGLKGSFTQTNRPLDNSGALYGQHISVAEDGSRGLRAYMSRHIPAAEMSQPGITELVVFNISPSGDVTGPQVLASIESNDRLGRGEITLSPDGRTLAYFNRNRYLGGFDYHTVEIYTVTLDQSGLMAASEPSIKAKGADYVTGRKGSIEWQGEDLYWNQYGIYSDGEEPVFARVLKTGQTQPVSSGEYGDLRFSGSDVYKLGQAGTSLKTASATAAADDRAGYLPGQPWRASGSGPQLSYRRKGIRQYELTDHLGNVRAVIGDRLVAEPETAGTATAYKPDLLSATDYFPFGMQMPGRVYSASEGYRYGFNGKEKETSFSSDSYDFGARVYNSLTGTFGSIDPLASKFPYESNYIFAGNNPISNIDVDGKFKWPAGEYGEKLKKEYPEAYNFIMGENGINKITQSKHLINTMINNTYYAQRNNSSSFKQLNAFNDFPIDNMDETYELSESDIIEAFTPGKGPYIDFTGKPGGNASANGYNVYNVGDNNSTINTPMQINVKLLDNLKSSIADPSNANTGNMRTKMALLRLSSAFIHEYEEYYSNDHIYDTNGPAGNEINLGCSGLPAQIWGSETTRAFQYPIDEKALPTTDEVLK